MSQQRSMASSPAGAAVPLRLHQRCALTSYGCGEVLFVGQTSFSHGVWVGIALDEPTGKHDGVVQGKRYFTARTGHGIFVRASQVHSLQPDDEDEREQQPTDDEDLHAQSPPPAPPTARATPATVRQTTSRASQVASRTSVAPSTSAPATRTASPVKPASAAAAAQRRMSGMPSTGSTTSAAAAFGGGGGGGAASTHRQTVSPQKRAPPGTASGTSSERVSPFKTPATRSAATARNSTTPGTVPRSRPSTTAASSSRPPSVTLRQQQVVSGERTPTQTPAARTAATVTAQRAALTQARTAVQAGRAPDTATARAGLRPVAKTRMSMAPPSSSNSVSSSAYPRTPAGAAISATRAVASSTAGAGPQRRAVPAGSTPASVSSTATRTPVPKVRGTPSSSRGSRQDARHVANEADRDEEDLMAMSIDELASAQHGMDHDEADEEADQDDDGDVPASPSLRKAAAAQPDHMSLSRGPSMTAIARSNADVATLQRELDEIRAKLRITEKKREEERDRVREAEHVQQEAEQFLAIKPKLAAKQQELQNQLKDLHKLEREWTTQREEYERQLAEMNDQVEILSLDKEMAEERAEATADEVQTLKDRLEELELDVEVLREENARFESGPLGEEADDKERLSVGYVQLEKQNERLKEALVRLRDLTAESDAEQKQRLAEKEKELRALDELQATHESVLARLQQSEALLEDLKIQLDDALGAEEILERLTERNMALSEKVDEMRMTIEDLEALKELNDELEETHIETEKQLQEELELKEMQMREQRMRNESLDANIVEYEGTFAQFRELVLTLQGEVETLRDDEKARDASRVAAGAEDQAMLNLNMKLHSSTLKSQAKTIEVEMGKLQAAEAKRQLDMISEYLPKRYFEHDKDAVESLLFFQRIAVKTEIIKSVVESKTDVAGSLVGIVDERLIVICRMRHSLAHFMASARQIAALVQLSSIPTFLKSGRMFKELASVERRIDQFVELLRREELKEDECAQDYRRFVKMLEEFEVALLDGSAEVIDSDLAAKELGSATLFDLDLDTIAAALGYAKQNVAALYNSFNSQQDAGNTTTTATSTATAASAAEGGAPTPLVTTAVDIEMKMNDMDIDIAFFTPMQDMITHVRSSKVPARKLLRRLAALYGNDEAVKMEAIVKLPGMGRQTSQLVAFSSTLAASLGAYTNNVRTNKVPFELKDVLGLVEQASREAMGSTSAGGASSDKTATAVWTATLQETAQLGPTVTDLLQAATEQENVQKIVGTVPWRGRVEEMRQEQETNAEAQRLITKQTEDLRDLYKQIKVRDEVIEENRIKLERVAKQLQRSRQDNETVTALRDDLVDTTKRMKAYEEGNSALQGELEQLQRQYEHLLDEGVRGRNNGDAATIDSAQTASGSTGGRGGAAEASAGNAGAGSHLAGTYSAMGAGSGMLPSSSYEVSYLLDQLEAMRGAIKYLRLENSLLKGRELLEQVERLPTLAPRLKRDDSGVSLSSFTMATTDELDAKNVLQQQRGVPRSKKEARMLGRGLPGGVNVGTVPADATTTTTTAAAAASAHARNAVDSKRLVQDWMRMASSPRVVTLTRSVASGDTRATAAPGTTVGKSARQRRPWVPMAQLPHHQFHEQMQERARLRKRIEELHAGATSSAGGGAKALRGSFIALRV